MDFLKTAKKNRKAAFAGTFYPLSKMALSNQLIELFENTRENQSPKGKVQALISPHAGYVFSGLIAASAYNQIPENQTYKRVFVLASSHRYRFDGAAVYTNGNYESPLGEIKVDQELIQKLCITSNLFQIKHKVHEEEHSLEVQLPFLQHKLGNDFLLVPIILGTHNPDHCKKIAQQLKPWFTPENLFVVSTDFSHYPEYEQANKIDLQTADAICKNKPKKFVKFLNKNKNLFDSNLSTLLCGWTSVLTLLYLTREGDYRYHKIEYKNSGDSKSYGDKKRVVGYWAMSILQNETRFQISNDEQVELLEKAQTAISKYLKTGKKEIQSPGSSKKLNEIAGAFVSIYIKDKLRGCIGSFAGKKTLNDLVQSIAISACKDKRFKNIKTSDLKNMQLEISVLSPLKKIKSTKEIKLGKHGIYMKQGFNTGTFLPQVATKTSWNLNEFLGHCSRDKAGIGWDGWKTAELYTYEAFIFKG